MDIWWFCWFFFCIFVFVCRFLIPYLPWISLLSLSIASWKLYWVDRRSVRFYSKKEINKFIYKVIAIFAIYLIITNISRCDVGVNLSAEMSMWTGFKSFLQISIDNFDQFFFFLSKIGFWFFQLIALIYFQQLLITNR